MHVDLRRGQTDALRGIHALEHFVDQQPNAVIDFANRLGDDVQTRIWIAQDVQLGHESNEFRAMPRRKPARDRRVATQRDGPHTCC